MRKWDDLSSDLDRLAATKIGAVDKLANRAGQLGLSDRLTMG